MSESPRRYRRQLVLRPKQPTDRPSSIRNKVLPAPLLLVLQVKQDRRIRRSQSASRHRIGEWKPIVPPGVAKQKPLALINSRKRGGGEDQCIKSRAALPIGAQAVRVDVDPFDERHAVFTAAVDPEQRRISHEKHVRIDDAGDRCPRGADRGQEIIDRGTITGDWATFDFVSPSGDDLDLLRAVEADYIKAGPAPGAHAFSKVSTSHLCAATVRVSSGGNEV